MSCPAARPRASSIIRADRSTPSACPGPAARGGIAGDLAGAAAEVEHPLAAGDAAGRHGATAFSRGDARYLFHPITVWVDPAGDERMAAASRAFATAMRPPSTVPPISTSPRGLNFTPEADRVRDADGGDKYAAWPRSRTLRPG
jgi:hypothetical protein